MSEAALNDSNPEIDSWVKRLTDSQMPIFGRTVQEIVNVSEKETSSALHLGQVVLKDASMTARILKLANSVHYNSSGRKFSTISQCIMMLGFDAVRGMSLTVSLIDSLVQGVHRDHLVKQMARSMHASAQAQEIARQAGDPKHEEVFIATLLFHIGDLAFWCFSDNKGDELSLALKKTNAPAVQVERDILGFTMNELSQGIAQAWGLSDLLQRTLKNPNDSDPTSQAICLSHQLAEAVEKGWESEAVTELTQSIAKLTGRSAKVTTEQLHQQAQKAAETTAYYGAKAVAKVIPLPSETQLDDTPYLADAFPEPDIQLQLQILQDLMSMSKGKTDFNMLIEMTLEGINRGVGMDHALFALLTPDRKQLKVKQVIGNNNDWLREHFKFNTGSAESKIWLHAFQQRQPLRLNEDSPDETKRLIPQSLAQKTKTKSFLVAPVVVKNKPIGLFYADRSLSHRPLDDDTFNSFQLFSQQVNMILNRAMGS
ncbi:hypothetical protein A9Q82_09290 [Cycloclasticus sp. 46_120_T64]|nr:hypothetical protein A9Q82_09290 [Cycloclasticus sp. 46_120_T64]